MFLKCLCCKSLLFQLVTFKIYAIKTVYCLKWLWRTSVRSSYWELFLEINLNQKILELYIEYIEVPMQMTKWNRKHTLLWNKHEYSHSADKFVKNIFNPFHGTSLFLCSFYTPWNKSENQRFPNVSLGIERNQCHEMGKESFNLQL